MDQHYNASRACLDLYWELSAFTLSLQEPDFIHQLALDTYTAQHAGPNLKPIAPAFALIGLYLFLERGYTGREVQLAHIKLGNLHKQWPRFQVPATKATLTINDVLKGNLTDDYRALLAGWGKSVWEIWEPEHENIRQLVKTNLPI
jgi:hypothetical protein